MAVIAVFPCLYPDQECDKKLIFLKGVEFHTDSNSYFLHRTIKAEKNLKNAAYDITRIYLSLLCNPFKYLPNLHPSI